MATEPIGSPQIRDGIGPEREREMPRGYHTAATAPRSRIMLVRGGGNERKREPMSGGARLPSGEPRKASQRRTRRAAPVPTVIEPSWRQGNKVHGRGYTGAFPRDAVDGQAEILIGTQTYLVRKVELQST